jgi:LytS/YehU family sensor histidine kinase
MNDHFYDYLLKQLNGISSIAVMENASATQKEIIKLTDHIRYKFGRKKEIVKLEDELSAVNNLITLYKSRIGNQLTYKEELVRGAKEIYLPQYTVMTFIENCLDHAFQTKEGTWEISLTVEREKEGYLLIIEDNGKGFDGVDRVVNGQVSNSSIYSVVQKLSAYYQMEQNLLKIESNQLGSTIKLQLVK